MSIDKRRPSSTVNGTADTRKIAAATGWLMVATFVTSIPAYFVFYAPARDNPDYITGVGADPTTSVALGAALELVVIVANVGTAVVPYAVYRRYSEHLALSYVAARLVEAVFISVGVISMLTFLLLRQEANAGAETAIGEALVAVYDRAFLVGPGIFAGVANGMILGYLMYRSELVPRSLSMFGLIGGPLVAASGIAVMFDVFERGGTAQAVATIPEFIWELSFGIYLIVKGFRPTASRVGLPDGIGQAGRRP